MASLQKRLQLSLTPHPLTGRTGRAQPEPEEHVGGSDKSQEYLGRKLGGQRQPSRGQGTRKEQSEEGIGWQI